MSFLESYTASSLFDLFICFLNIMSLSQKKPTLSIPPDLHVFPSPNLWTNYRFFCARLLQFWIQIRFTVLLRSRCQLGNTNPTGSSAGNGKCGNRFNETWWIIPPLSYGQYFPKSILALYRITLKTYSKYIASFLMQVNSNVRRLLYISPGLNTVRLKLL